MLYGLGRHERFGRACASECLFHVALSKSLPSFWKNPGGCSRGWVFGRHLPFQFGNTHRLHTYRNKLFSYQRVSSSAEGMTDPHDQRGTPWVHMDGFMYLPGRQTLWWARTSQHNTSHHITSHHHQAIYIYSARQARGYGTYIRPRTREQGAAWKKKAGEPRFLL